MILKCVNSRGTKDINLEEILYFEAFRDDCFCFTVDHKYKVKNFKLYDAEVLGEFGFIRIHKSYVVNIFKIVTLTPQINSRIKLRVKNYDVIHVNRSYIKPFKQYLKKGDYKR